MRIFITGGSGFVGGHAIAALVGRHEVLALARSPTSAARVEALGARAVRGELGAVDAAALAGVDAVIHAAAFVEEWGTRAQYWAANVDGTAQLLAAARRAGVRRLIHVGTEAALFTGVDLVEIDERMPLPRRHRYLYSETKAEAERQVLAANDGDLTTLVIRPRLVWGEGDTTVLPTLLRMARAGGFAWIDGGHRWTSTTHVDNLVHALDLALTRGRGGEAYFVTDAGTRTLREFLTALARTRGVELPDRSLPSALVRPLAALLEGLWRLLRIRRPPPMTRFAIDMLACTLTIRIDKARRELGYTPVIAVEDGLARLAAHPEP